MRSEVPLIGITAANDPEYRGLYVVRWDYARGVEAAGGIPVILAPSLKIPVGRVLDRLDGLIFSGGRDIDPSLYGGRPAGSEPDEGDRERDAFELDLMRRALERDLPVLGISRGMHMLNVARGGDLIPDIDSHLHTAVHHDDPNRPRHRLAHLVEVEEGSRLYHVSGAGRFQVNSFHHQAVDRLGRGLRASAHASDGVVEAIEISDRRLVLGLQWHPEALVWQGRPYSSQLAAVVEAARAA